MNVAALLSDLGTKGLSLHIDGADLRVRGRQSQLTPDVRDLIRRHKQELRAALEAREAEQCAALVARVGERMQHYFAHCEEWPEEKRWRRLDALHADHRALDAALARTGKKIEDFGWTVTAGGDWHRLTDAAPEPACTELQALFLKACQRIEAACGVIGSGPEWDAVNARLDAAAAANDPDAYGAALRDMEALAVASARKGEPPPPAWDTETIELIDWLRSWEPPAASFKLHPWMTVADSHAFRAALLRDVAAGPGSGRALTGALQADLRRLSELFGG
jgi:hypothetical protein